MSTRSHDGTMSGGSVSERALLKPAEVAVQLGVSRTWLYDAAKRGLIPSIRLGGPDGPLRFVREDLELWIERARAQWSPGRGTRAIAPHKYEGVDAEGIH
jgi:excisionase family DNA binding protein